MAEKIMAEQKAAKQGGWAKFMHWYESYQGKKVVNCIYSAGASVVIIGALFKIMHFQGAGAVLMTGMITEAFLFLIGCLEKPHPEFHWGNVFPQLLEYGTEPKLLEWAQNAPKPTLLGAGVAEGEMDKKAPAVPALTDADMKVLKTGIEDLAKTAGQLSELSTFATASSKLGEKMDAAGQAAEAFLQAGKQVSEKSEKLCTTYSTVSDNMAKVAEGTKQYSAKVETIGSQLNKLNSVYEMHIKAVEDQISAVNAQVTAVNAQVTKVNAQSSQIDKMAALTAEAIKSHEAYEAGTKKLAKQIADLNAVYGNMLTALA